MNGRLFAKLLRVWPYSTHQFALWRIVFGSYLTFYALVQIPYAAALYSNQGIFAEQIAPLLFPSPLYWNADPALVYLLVCLQVLAAVGITLGYLRRSAAVLYLLVAGSFLQWNPLSEDPAMAFVHLGVFLLAVLPLGEPLTISKSGVDDWQMPYFVYVAGLWAMGLGYSLSGWDKFYALGWQTGDALYYLLSYSMAWDVWWVDFLASQSISVIRLETWLIGGVMLLALPGLLWPKTRPYFWLALTFLFIGTLFVFDLIQVSLGMLLFHAFLFDRRWLPGRASKGVLYYDADCGFCRACIKFVQMEDWAKRVDYQPLRGSQFVSAGQCCGSIIYITEGRQEKYSDALVSVLLTLGGLWQLLGYLLRFLPKNWRDWGYRQVGRLVNKNLKVIAATGSVDKC